jgi:hypothetical protein
MSVKYLGKSRAWVPSNNGAVRSHRHIEYLSHFLRVVMSVRELASRYR